jgi:D-serine deaminase-like pyridoxal phosphate-dependent protein
MTDSSWFQIANIDTLDSPALAIYPDRVRQNIDTLVNSIDDVTRLRPHVKTHKSAEVSRMMLDRGIKKFKCATIAEAEVLAGEGAPDVLLAYQPVGPKSNRLLKLSQKFPHTTFSCLIDNVDSARALSDCFGKAAREVQVFIDLNIGMNRTGIAPADALNLISTVATLPHIRIRGLHAYDGHLRDTDLAIRKRKCDAAFVPVMELKSAATSLLKQEITVVAGGTPSYSIHRTRAGVECSPGTFIYWDQGYADMLQEQKYRFAALVITRVVSLPKPGLICLDLGHKAIASESSLDKRVTFLNGGALNPVGHSEEHMVFEVADDRVYAVGDVLYGVPFHICPTVALHQTPAIVYDGNVREYWNTASRSRMITV